ncbi:3-deoxy-manno-octulosonate cytidylyltransferase [Moheibacter sp.]|uniref:3-deoxy-manno-octulosonate cytidylyltransferase n=1 Tax=Moheibacter sp. TaxID=1965316 RepID=UPI003C756BB3
MRTIAVIPARFAATRFPGKLMARLGDKSVIQTTYENTLKTGLFEDVFVVTDSEVIFEEITQNGGKAIMSKTEHQTGSDRIAEAIEDLDCDIVVNVQGDEPFVKKEALQKLVDAYKNDLNEEISLATLAQEITDEEDIQNPNSVKVNWDIHHFALYFSRSPIPYPRETNFRAKYYQHIGIYAFRKSALLNFTKLPMLQNERAEKLEQLRYLEYGMKIKVLETGFMGIGIDTPEDLEKANAYLKILQTTE